jgi:hypothetical protein
MHLPWPGEKGLNERIQAATPLDDVNAVCADCADFYRDRL